MGRKKRVQWRPLHPELAAMMRGGRATPDETIKALQEFWDRPTTPEEIAAWDKVREWLDEGRSPELRHFRDEA